MKPYCTCVHLGTVENKPMGVKIWSEDIHIYNMNAELVLLVLLWRPGLISTH